MNSQEDRPALCIPVLVPRQGQYRYSKSYSRSLAPPQFNLWAHASDMHGAEGQMSRAFRIAGNRCRLRETSTPACTSNAKHVLLHERALVFAELLVHALHRPDATDRRKCIGIIGNRVSGDEVGWPGFRQLPSEERR